MWMELSFNLPRGDAVLNIFSLLVMFVYLCLLQPGLEEDLTEFICEQSLCYEAYLLNLHCALELFEYSRYDVQIVSSLKKFDCYDIVNKHMSRIKSRLIVCWVCQNRFREKP